MRIEPRRLKIISAEISSKESVKRLDAHSLVSCALTASNSEVSSIMR